MIRRFVFWVLLWWCLTGIAAESLPVTPRERYILKFELRGTGQVFPEEWYCRGDELDYPGVAIRFLDKDGQAVPVLPFSNFHVAFSTEFIPGEISFYAPDNAASVEVSGKNAEFRNLQLEKVPSSLQVSIDLDHRVSGTFRRTVFTPAEDNMTVFDTSASYIYCSPIPVRPGEKYRLTVSGRRSERSETVIRVWFFRDSLNNRQSLIGRNHSPLRVGGAKENFEYIFTVPQGTGWVRVTFMWGIIWNYRMEKVD